jgi:hypothetical protein
MSESKKNHLEDPNEFIYDQQLEPLIFMLKSIHG